MVLEISVMIAREILLAPMTTLVVKETSVVMVALMVIKRVVVTVAVEMGAVDSLMLGGSFRGRRYSDFSNCNRLEI